MRPTDCTEGAWSGHRGMLRVSPDSRSRRAHPDLRLAGDGLARLLELGREVERELVRATTRRLEREVDIRILADDAAAARPNAARLGQRRREARGAVLGVHPRDECRLGRRRRVDVATHTRDIGQAPGKGSRQAKGRKRVRRTRARRHPARTHWHAGVSALGPVTPAPVGPQKLLRVVVLRKIVRLTVIE